MIGAPGTIRVEATNILRRLELAKQLSPVECGLAQQDLMRLDIQLFPFHPAAERVWALRKNITSYDAWYVALARDGRTPDESVETRVVDISQYRWEKHCRGLLQLPVAV